MAAPARLRPLRLSERMDDVQRKARLAYAIRAARQSRGISPPELGRRVGRSAGTINRWEEGVTVPSLLDLGPLCQALGVDPRLFAELPPVPPNPVAEFLVGEALAEGLEEGRKRASRRRARPEAQ